MRKSSGTAIFLDTTIQIARVVHSDESKQQIRDTIGRYTLRVSSEVVKLEFRRRLLEEVQWCLNQLSDPRKPKTFESLFRHITDFLPLQQDRKKRICTQICHTVLAVSARGDLTECAKRHFRTLLRTGMAIFEIDIGHIVKDSGCACASHPIVENKAYKRYDFGPVECGKCRESCGIAEFLSDQEPQLSKVLDAIGYLPANKRRKPDGKLTEMGQIEFFLIKLMREGENPFDMNPCLKVGDLLIALESRIIPDFYTMNWAESQFLCRWMGQNLILRRVYPQHDDIKYLSENSEWLGPK
jgi:hypothetical protein